VPHFPLVSRFLVRSDVNCTTAQHNWIRTEQSAFEKFCREALLRMLLVGHIRHRINSGYAAYLRSIISFSVEKTTKNLRNHFRKQHRYSKYECSSLVKLPVFSSDTVPTKLCFRLFSPVPWKLIQFYISPAVRDAICRKPPGIKRFREGWELYNKQLCLYFRVHALFLMINRVVGCNIACTLVSQGAAEETGTLWSPVFHTEQFLYVILWSEECYVQSAAHRMPGVLVLQ
jgi:hypothetical protein